MWSWVFLLTIFVLFNLLTDIRRLPDPNLEESGGYNSIFGLAIFMGGLVQIIVGVMEFCIGNTFGMTTHSSFGAFWLSYAMFLVPSLNIKGAYGGDIRAYSFSIGIYLITWSFVTFVFLVAAIKTNYTSISLYSFLFLSLLCSAVSNFILTTHPVISTNLNKTGGAFSVICAMLAFYLASSGLITRERTNIHLPLGDIAK